MSVNEAVSSAQCEMIHGNGQRETDKRNPWELHGKDEMDLFSFMMFIKLPLPLEEIVFMPNVAVKRGF